MSQPIDWPGIRAAAVAIGVREAARRAAANLPPDEQERFVFRVLKRSTREHWLEVKAGPMPPERNEKPLSSTVLNGSESLQSKLAEDSDATRMAFSTATRKHAEHFAKLKPSVKKDRALAVKSWAGVGSITHGWEGDKGAGGVSLNILSIGGDMIVSPS